MILASTITLLPRFEYGAEYRVEFFWFPFVHRQERFNLWKRFPVSDEPVLGVHARTTSIVQLVMKQCRFVAPCITPPTLFLADPYCSDNKGLSALSCSRSTMAHLLAFISSKSHCLSCASSARGRWTGSDPCGKCSPKKSRQVDGRFLSRCLLLLIVSWFSPVRQGNFQPLALATDRGP